MPENLAERVIKLMPQSNDLDSYRNQFATLLDHTAELDDLSLLRTAKEADAYESDFLQFASSFPGVRLAQPIHGSFYGAALSLVKLDRVDRTRILKSYAAALLAAK